MQNAQGNEPFWKRHSDKIGIGGSVFAALCCLGFPALLAFTSALGLGFLIKDAVLIPLLIVFLGVTLWGLYRGMRHHRRWWAFGAGAAGALALLLSIWFGNSVVAALGIAALVAASLLNVVLRVRQLRAR